MRVSYCNGVAQQYSLPAQSQPLPDLGIFDPPFDDENFFAATTNYPEYPNDDYDKSLLSPADTPTTLKFHVKIDRYYTDKPIIQIIR